jgi:hypothetical protein
MSYEQVTRTRGPTSAVGVERFTTQILIDGYRNLIAQAHKAAFASWIQWIFQVLALVYGVAGVVELLRHRHDLVS